MEGYITEVSNLRSKLNLLLDKGKEIVSMLWEGLSSTGYYFYNNYTKMYLLYHSWIIEKEASKFLLGNESFSPNQHFKDSKALVILLKILQLIF